MNGKPPCELRIIRVTWAKKNQPLSVQVADDPIDIEPDGNGWVSEISAYPVVPSAGPGQLAVKYDGAEVPALLTADDQPVKMEAISFADGSRWWIENGQWRPRKAGGYHDAPLCRHVGEARLRLGDSHIRLRVSAPGFAGEDFDALLEEFRNGAWQLILDPMSPARGTDRRADGGIDPAFLKAVSAFIRSASRALDQPHRELREVKESQPIQRVRPHPGTFRELAVRGAPRQISGRGHVASFDTPENRQLLSMCVRLGRTLKGLAAGAEGATRDLLSRARRAEERVDQLQASLGRARVDPRRLDHLIEELEGQRSEYQRNLGQLITGAPANTKLYPMDIPNPKVDASHGEAGFWYNSWSECGEPEGVRLNFDTDLRTLASVFDKRCKYRIVGTFTRERSGTSDRGRRWSIWRVCHLTEIASDTAQQLQREITKLQAQRSSLSERDFWIALNSRETDEQRRDIGEARKSARRLHAASETWRQTTVHLRPLAYQLRALADRARDMGIRERRTTGFTGSMTYVQNPDYRGAVAAYRRALENAGLEASQLDGLLRLEDLGILDLPRIYERWCLLRLVAVLREHFNLLPPAGLQQQMLGSILKDQTLSLRFEGPEIGRDVLLEYQPRLSRADRPRAQWPTPDFSMEVIPRDDRQPQGSPHCKLVLDAKCKPFRPIGDREPGPCLIDELHELIDRRGYTEPGDNRVFVLHPGRGPDSAADRFGYCRYGGNHLVADGELRPSWDQGPPNHMRGAVLLRPGVTDPLIRLILMHLYLGLDDSLSAYDSRPPAFRPVCPTCGGAEMTDQPPPDTRSTDHPGRAQWCVRCDQMVVWNYSGGCGTHLWKLGGYWTFHETHPLNPYNILCPHCGDYMSVAGVDALPNDIEEPAWFL
jgi:pyrethroid hydrolase